MIRFVIFDMFETLVTLHHSDFPYFGGEIAKDAGIPREQFYVPWEESDLARTCGKVTFEEVISNILKKFSVYSTEKLSMIVEKRNQSKQRVFEQKRPDILPMLADLKKEGCKIGLCSNSYLEENGCIRQSDLFPYFDVPVLSCEVGLAKPDPAIFRLCMERLWDREGAPDASQFLYIGDGGSEELETASSLGMNAYQAVWYIVDGTDQPADRKPEFPAFETPGDVVKFVREKKRK